jgi:glyoxylase-like metal-dependent hydrolase (beta-lactamase superfamily II)
MRNPMMTRRGLLFNAGAGVLGVALLQTFTGCSTSPDATGTDPTRGPTSSPTSNPTGTVGGDWRRVDLSFVAAYLLIRGGEAAVVDLGTGGSGGSIGAALTAAGSGWDAVRHVILTHHHPDHAGGLADVAREMAARSAAAIYAGEADVARITSSKPVRALKDDDDVFGLRIIGTPGHTAGHVAVFDPATGVLVAGDALRTTGADLTGPDPRYTDDLARANASVRKLAALDVRAILPGHGDPMTVGAAEALRALADSLPAS